MRPNGYHRATPSQSDTTDSDVLNCLRQSYGHSEVPSRLSSGAVEESSPIKLAVVVPSAVAASGPDIARRRLAKGGKRTVLLRSTQLNPQHATSLYSYSSSTAAHGIFTLSYHTIFETVIWSVRTYTTEE